MNELSKQKQTPPEHGRKSLDAKKDSANMKRWVDAWRLAGPELQRIQDEELRAYSHEDNWLIIDGLLELGAAHAVPREISGLVEQQRLFQRARK